MANKKRTRRDSDPPDSSWMDDLAFDPAEHPDARAVVGYVSGGPNSRAVKLYVNLDLHDYLEIRPNDILDRRTLGSDESLPRVVLWLKGSAAVRAVRVFRVDAQAQFLSGRIAEQFLQGAAGTSYAVAQVGKTTTVLTVQSVCFMCGAPTAAC
jgi:hypothetical protein